MTCPECQRDMTEFAEFSARTNSIVVTIACPEPDCPIAFRGTLYPYNKQAALDEIGG